MRCPFGALLGGQAPPGHHPTRRMSAAELLANEHKPVTQQVLEPPSAASGEVEQTVQGSSDDDFSEQEGLHHDQVLRTSTQTWLNAHQAPTLPLAHSVSAPSLANLGEALTTSQPWQMKRPILSHCPKQSRRELRRQNRRFTLEEVAQHKYVDDIWIAVDGKVYDITEHLVAHDGWGTAGVTTPLSILAHGGMDCSEEFHQIHRVYPVAYKQLAAFYIGELDTTSQQQ